jgi:GT2 family glycosyltransferase
MLTRCLSSIAAFRVPDDVEFRVVVIENTRAPARMPDVIRSFPGYIHYMHEPRLGIPFARNAAIDFAVKQAASALLFLDDDQTAPSTWLANMLETYVEEGVDAVRSKVVCECEVENRYSRYFQSGAFPPLPRFRDVTLRRGATNGVLIGRRLFVDLGLRFDERLGLKGGEDVLFFQEARRYGATLSVTTEVPAVEFIPKQKQTARWLLRRAFRGGNVQGIVRSKQKSQSSLLYGACRECIRHLWLAVRSLRHETAFYHVRKAAHSVGMVCAALGLEVRDYKRVIGS